MVEKNTATCMQAIGFPIIHGQPMGIDFCASVGRSRPKGRGLNLGYLLNFTIHFRRRSLIISNLFNQTGLANRLKNTHGPQSSDVARIFRNIERYPNMALSTQIINLVRLQIIQQLDQLDCISEISVMEIQVGVIH